MKGIDHLVLCVNDLDRAGRFYEQLGFTLTPQAQHPFGTTNRLVQMHGFFLEILAVNQPENIPADRQGQFNFARFSQAYLAQREGISMMVMDSEDAKADHKAAIKAGLETYCPFSFSRKARLPDGSSATVSFGLNFVTHRDMKLAGFFTCHQFNPDLFWKREYQRHANTAQSISEVCLVADDPHKYGPFMAAFSHCSITGRSAQNIRIETARGAISIVTPVLFEKRYQAKAPDMDHGPQLAGFTISVSDLSKVAKPVAADAFGAAILFEQST